jgi:thioredoxin reductase (NADPH)
MSQVFDIAIAGGGIAGLTAGLTAARLGKKSLVLTGGLPGGQLVSIEKIDGYPGFPDGVPGYDLCPMAQEQAAAAGAEFAATELQTLEPKDGIWRLATAEGDHTARAVILATGSSLRELGIPGEARFKGKGVSHCATCDAPLLKGKPVVVVGGGDSALQEALTLAQFAARVTIVQRGPALTAQLVYRQHVTENPRIEIRCDTTVEEILGDTGVTGVRLREAARNAPTDLEVAGVFVYIGLQPNTAFLNGQLALDADGRIPTDSAMRTALPGVFAAGSVRSGWAGRAAVSAGDGATAAIAAAGGSHG